MTEILGIATVWLGLAVFSTILANHLRVSMALMEICVGVSPRRLSSITWGTALSGPMSSGCVSWRDLGQSF